MLTPLGEIPAAELLDALTAGQDLAPSTRARVIDTATGNPLYLEQLAVSLSEQAGSEIRLALPPTIQALLTARLQRLGPGASSVLARAAIIGKEFGEQAIRELLPPDARQPLSRNLRTLIAKGLVQQQGPAAKPRGGVQLPAHPDPAGGLSRDSQVAPRRTPPAPRRLA